MFLNGDTRGNLQKRAQSQVALFEKTLIVIYTSQGSIRDSDTQFLKSNMTAGPKLPFQRNV